MRILAVTTESDLPEAHILCGLQAKSAEVLCLGSRTAQNRSIIEKGAVTYHPFEFRSRVSPYAISTVRKIVRSFKPNIIHSFSGRGLSASLFATIDSKALHVAYRGTMGHLSRWDPTSWISFLNPRVRMTVCVSKAVEEYMLSVGVPPSRLCTIYKGHDVNWYSSPGKQDLAQFGVPEDAFVVCFTGNMRPVKGADLLLLALRTLPSSSKIHVLFIGEVRDKLIEELAVDPLIAPRAHFTGFRSDATKLISACQVIIMPTRKREGLGKAVIEGMSQGLCPVVSGVGGMRELVEENESGLIIPSSDVGAIAHALLKLEQDPALCQRLGKNAKIRIEKSFDITTSITKYFDLYERLLAA